MDLIERYLQAVRFWLPRKSQDDLIAELAEDLRSQAEEAEGALGRPLDKAETAALLRRTGNPLEVAGRYLAQGPLLDPALALIFRFVVKVVLLWILLPLTVVAAVPAALFSPHPLSSMAGAILSYGCSAVFALGCITLVFTLVGGTRKGSGWDPLKLPPLRRQGDVKPIPRSRSLFELVFGLLFAGWWLGASRGLPLAWSSLSGPVWSAGPLWADFHGRWLLPILALTLANCAAAAISLARPHWVTFRLAFGALSSTLAAAMCLTTLTAHRPALLEHLQALRTLHLEVKDAASLGLVMEQTVALTLLVVAVSCLGSALSQGVRLAKRAKA